MKKQNKFNVNFIGIGVEKSGSTWVSKNLADHPQICFSQPKEVHFFNDKQAYILQRETNNNFYKGLEWYAKRFKHCGQDKIKGEFSTHYMWDKKAAERIAKYYPNVKLIICLRDPVTRAYSQYNMYRFYYKKETRNFEEVIKNEREYIEKGLYMQQINDWLKYFNSNQLHIVLLDDIITKPKSVIKNLYEYLGVDEEYLPPFLEKSINSKTSTYIPLVNDLMKLTTDKITDYRMSKLIIVLKKLGVKKIIKLLNTKKISYPNLSLDTKKILYKEFKNDLLELEKFLNRDLSSWKY